MRNHLSDRLIDDLFARIHAILGTKFFEAYRGNGKDEEQAKQATVFRNEWAAALADFKPIELERGLAMLARSKFVPTLGEFCQLCRPCLDPEYAFHEAYRCLLQRDAGMRGDWSHPAVWRAASTLALEVRQSDYAKVRTRWRLELERELSHGWGDPVPEPPLKLADDTKVTNDSAVALRERARIRQMLIEAKGGGNAGNA